MPYDVILKSKFAAEFANLPEDYQNKILDFAAIYKAHGLNDFNVYEGKIAPSWSSLEDSHPNFSYTREYSLWHYHLGIPEYVERHNKYKTSDVVLHFSWPGQGATIYLVDVYSHYDSNGNFYLPSAAYLEDF